MTFFKKRTQTKNTHMIRRQCNLSGQHITALKTGLKKILTFENCRVATYFLNHFDLSVVCTPQGRTLSALHCLCQKSCSIEQHHLRRWSSRFHSAAFFFKLPNQSELKVYMRCFGMYKPKVTFTDLWRAHGNVAIFVRSSLSLFAILHFFEHQKLCFRVV